MVEVLTGDCRAVLPTLPADSVQCVVTSPPYWGLRDYGTASWDGGDPACDHRGPPQQSAASTLAGNGHGNGKPLSPSLQAQAQPYRDTCGKCGATRIDQQLGLEATPEAYLETMVGVFRQVRRVLRDDGTVWCNMGDSYVGGPPGSPGAVEGLSSHASETGKQDRRPALRRAGMKPKDLVGMPWRLAFALQADGWYLRSDIIWAKPNPMPESVTDRPTKAHEYVFLLTKSARYFFDADAVREPASVNKPWAATTNGGGKARTLGQDGVGLGQPADDANGRNLRSVWTIPTEPTPDAHFATFPRQLAQRCILAGTSAKGCCAACGAPWARVVESTGGPPNNRFRDGLAGDCKTAHATGTVAGAALSRLYREHGYPTKTTTGWHPTCDHDAPVVPCVVLDPFGGTGTVGRVAEDLGRHSILIELNPAYVALAARKTAQRGLFAQATKA